MVQLNWAFNLFHCPSQDLLPQSPQAWDPRVHCPCRPSQPALRLSPSSRHQCSRRFQRHFSRSKLPLLKQGPLLPQLPLPPRGPHRAWHPLNPHHDPAPLTLCHPMLPRPRQPLLHRLVPAPIFIELLEFLQLNREHCQFSHWVHWCFCACA